MLTPRTPQDAQKLLNDLKAAQSSLERATLAWLTEGPQHLAIHFNTIENTISRVLDFADGLDGDRKRQAREMDRGGYEDTPDGIAAYIRSRQKDGGDATTSTTRTRKKKGKAK